MRYILVVFLLFSCSPRYQLGDEVSIHGTYGICTGRIKEVTAWPYMYSFRATCSGVRFPVDVTNIPESSLVR